MESCGRVTPSGIMGSSNSSSMSTTTIMEPGFIGDTYGGSKFFSSSVHSTFGGDGGGGTGSSLRAFGIFATGPEEVGRSALDGALAIKNWAPVGCMGGRVIGICASRIPGGG